MTKNKKRKSSPATGKKASSADALKTTIISCASICLLVIAACFSYLGLMERPAVNQQAILTQSQTLGASQASLLDQALTQLRLRLSNFALSEKWLNALEANDQIAIANFQQELNRAFPEAISAQLIALGPLGIASLSNTGYKFRNNIELDLLRHASNGENIEPEAYKHQGQWLFSLAEPIKSATKNYASGALFITLNEQYLNTLLSQLDSSLGNTSLIQQFNNKQHVITTTGNTQNNDTAVVVDSSIPHWQIIFKPSAELITSSSHSTLIIWIMLAAIVSLVAMSLMSLYSNLKKKLTADLNNLTDSEGRSNHFALPGFAEAASQLKSKLHAQAPVATVAKQPAPPPPTVEEEELDFDLGDLTENNQPNLPSDLPETIFRAYDIRGIAELELTDEIVHAIGLAIGSEALDQGQQSVVVAADGRHSSPRIQAAIIEGLIDSGRDVINIGIVPTPVMYFATHQLGSQSGVMITGSHNPAEYNGIKIVIGGKALSGPAIKALRQRVLNNDLSSGTGQETIQDIDQSYIDYIINDVAIAQPLKIVIDAGNGVAGGIAPRLFEELGCEVIQLYCEVDGNFPNHHPDPSVEANLTDLKQVVLEQQADLGIAFDGDGDRVGVVTASGQSVAADRLLMLLAQDVVSRNPGADVVFDVKCTRNLNTLISNYGGRPIMWKSGHSFMKEKMAETGALLGGEYSGHIFFKERWFGFDDGLYAAARLIEILSTTDPDLDLQLQSFPESFSSPEIKISTTEQKKFDIIEQLVSQAQFDDGKLSTLDGLRVDFSDGWGLVRASNTTPTLTLRFEAEGEEAMERIKALFKDQLSAVDTSLSLDF